MKFFIILLMLTGCVKVSNDDLGHQYVGAKYVLDPLGEETLPDTDPLIRTDAFDCTTFIETVLANGDVGKLTQIRYKDGKVNFLNRNHFIETDWLSNNADMVENISNKFAETEQRIVTIDKQNWLKKTHKIDAEFPKQTVALDYIPYNRLARIVTKEPLIVLFITGKSEKSAKIGTDLAVVHMGLLLPNGTLRHASSQYERVMDTDFYEYVLQRAKSKNNIGISLVKIK